MNEETRKANKLNIFIRYISLFAVIIMFSAYYIHMTNEFSKQDKIKKQSNIVNGINYGIIESIDIRAYCEKLNEKKLTVVYNITNYVDKNNLSTVERIETNTSCTNSTETKIP